MGRAERLSAAGVRPSTFAPRTQVRMRINPMVNGLPGGGFVGAKLADGAIVGDWE